MYEMGRFATSLISVQFKKDGLDTGVAIVNTGAGKAAVTLRLKDSNGTLLATNSLALDPGSQTARFVNELFSAELPSNFQGVLEVSSSDEGIVTMGLLVSQGVLTSVPTIHYGQISMMP
jgi:hypothetical protein